MISISILGILPTRWRRLPHRPLVASKFDRIMELVEGREVLDCGCVGGEIHSDAQFEQTTHAALARRAKYCLGIDIWKEEVEKRRSMGLSVVHGNVETMSLGRTFDVIVAADVIEHLANPGMFLDRAHEHLRDGGRLCLVTPNAFSLNNALKYALGREPGVHPEHTTWYDFVTLRQLLARHRFETVEEYWQDYGRNGMTRLALAVRPNLAAHIMVVARKKGDAS